MKHEAVGHPKMYNLAEAVSIPVYAAHGILEMLWHFTGDYAAQGDIGKISDSRIAAGVHWERSPDILIVALVDSAWLDSHETYRLIVHDWPDHAQEWIRKKLKRSHLDWLPVYGKSLYVSGDLSRHSLDNVETQSRQRRDTSSLTDNQYSKTYLSRQRLDTVSTNAREGSKGEGSVGSGTSSLSSEIYREGREGEKRARANGHGAHWKTDSTFAPFVEAYNSTGKALIDADWSAAYFEWQVLDMGQKLEAVKGVHARVKAGLCSEPQFVHLPKNYLAKHEWERPVVKRKATSRDELEAYWNS